MHADNYPTSTNTSNFSLGFQPAKWIKEGNYLQLDQSGKFSKIKDIEWFTDTKQAQQFLDCLINLVSYNSIYISASFQMLVSSFIPKESESGELNTEMVDQISRSVHVTLRKILELVPLSAKLLLDAVRSHYPYMKKQAPVLCCYLKNVLLITQYCPSILPPLLHVVFEKLLRIDVEIKLEDKDEETTNGMLFDEEIDQIELTQDQILANKLDSLLLIVFDYFDATFGMQHRSSSSSSSDHTSRDPLQYSLSVLPPSSFLTMTPTALQQEGVFTVVLEIFDTVILPTYKSKYIQFLVFYLCRLKRRTAEGLLADMFLAYLFNKLMNIQEPMHLRLSCASYFGSFVARAKYLSTKSVSVYLQSLQTWLAAYLDSQQQSTTPSSDTLLHPSDHHHHPEHQQTTYNNTKYATPDAQVHGLFYLMSQSLFYIFCFHHEELQQQNLLPTGFSSICQKICKSELNPLKVCLPAVVQEFARLVTTQGWFDAEAIVSANSKIILATVSSWGSGGGGSSSGISSSSGGGNITGGGGAGVSSSSGGVGLVNQLESFFPFDPYLLKASAGYINELYMEWRGEEEDSSDSDDAIGSDNESDNELMEELNKDFMSLSTPVEDKDVHFRLAFSP
eukprot:TRINITY_DN3784_c1_g1_i3.p1 TRINITY_DN3784_c1_g1~~TRINITY_DN3784_c1_g1_i3.p1  ORF type:complete len:620 (-),score=178.98 TRINITY_DN3784_c1_g1_i3:30-1889(-)